MPMYEEVVVDVMKLRDEAKRYGENVLLEQFAPKINEAIASILEQDPLDDEELGGPEAPGLPPEAGNTAMGGLDTELGDELGVGGEDAGLESELATDLPLAATEGEKACQCPDEEEVIDIDFDSLMKIGEPAPGEEPLAEPEDLYEGCSDMDEESEEDFNLDEVDLGQFEEGLKEIAEELKVDFEEPEATGWGGVPEKVKADAEDELIASMMDDDRKKEYKKTQKALDSLKEEFEQLNQEKILLEKKSSSYKKKIKDFEDIVLKQQQKLRSLTTMNSRLLYVNKVLTNESLNGLQKQKIVESLSKAKNAEEAKLIFETLQSTVGSQNQKRKPKSLSEVVENSPQTMKVMPSGVTQPKKALIEESVKSRLKKLAGI